VWVVQKDYKVVGAILLRIRKEAGLGQDELARLLGKPQSFISTYERGQRRIDVLELIRICSALKSDPTAVMKELSKRFAAPKLSRRKPN
jgi:transcriptional regulator with XRE-family HTH domain